MAQRIVIPGFRKIETSSGGGEGGTTNYNDLTNKPSVNNVPLVGNLSTVDLKLTDKTLTEEGVPAEAKIVGEKLEEQSTSLTALSGQLGNHTVKSDVPENAVFTDTVYDDTELQKKISDNGYGEVSGGKSLIPDKDMNNLLSKMSDNTDGTTHSYADGVLTVNRIANVNSGVYVYNSIFRRFNNKKIKISFDAKCSVSGMVLSIFLNNSSYSYTPILTSEYKRYSVEVVAGDTAHNFIIYGNTVAGEVNIKNVMFSDAAYNDTSYEPYFPSNKMLEDEVSEQNESLSVIGKCKNLLNPTLQTTTSNGVTCTANGDGTYTLNGTATQNTDFNLFDNLGKYQHLKNRTVKLVGCPKQGSLTTYRLMLQLQQSPWTSATDYGEGSSVTVDDKNNWMCWIRIYKDATVSNLTFKPMITTKLNATYDDFVPYTGDGDTLIDDVASLLKRIETLESIVNKTDTTVTE